MVKHLIEAKTIPKAGLVDLRVAAEIFRPRFNSIHTEMRNAIYDGQPPHRWVEHHANDQCEKRMHTTVQSQGFKKSPIGQGFIKNHVLAL